MNEYIQSAVRNWHNNGRTYCLINKTKRSYEYLVRVVPDKDREEEGYWLNDGQTWETESGAAWSILTSLDDNLGEE